MNEFVINVAQDPSTIININNSDGAVSLDIGQNQQNSITIEDDVNNVLLNPSVFYNGINIVYLSGVSGELLHNAFGDLQGGSANQYYHLSSGQYFNLTTGSVIRPSETGAFYTIANPSGFISTGEADLRFVNATGSETIRGIKTFLSRPTVNSVGVLLIGEATTQGYVTGISGGLQTQITTLNNQTGSYYPKTNPSGYITGSVVRPSDTGNFITTGQTGAFYPRSNPSGFITGVDLSAYVTGDVVRPSQTGNFITTSQTGAFYPSSNPSGFITGIDLSAYVTGAVIRPSDTGAFYPVTNPSGYITGVDLSSYATIGFVTGISGYLQPQITNLNNQTGSYVTGSVVRPSETGVFVAQSQTGQFYAASNPSGFITGVDLSGYVTGAVVRPSETGVFITQSQTGQFYAASNPSGFITGISNLVYTTGDQNITGVKTFLSAPTISGNQVATAVDPVRTTLTGNGSLSAFSINGAGSLSNPSALIVAIDGALQEPTVDYGVSGGVITFTSPLASGAKAVVISPTNTLQVTQMIPADGSVSSAKLANSISIGTLGVAGNLTVDTNTFFVDSVNNRVGIGTTSPSARLHTVSTTEQVRFGYDVSNYWNATTSSTGVTTLSAAGSGAKFVFANDVEFGANATIPDVIGNTSFTDDVEVLGEMTATGQPVIGALGDNHVTTKLLADYEAMINGNEFRQFCFFANQLAGAGSSASAYNVIGMQASTLNTLSGSASTYTYDGVLSNSGFSGHPLRTNLLVDMFFHGVMLRVNANTNWVIRINFGVGAATRVPPAAGVAAASSRQWGVEFYYDGVNYVGRMYWYDTSMVYGTPFTIPNITNANWPNLVYSIRMRQTTSGLLEFYINTPTATLGGGRLSDTPTTSMQATWTSNFYGGRGINFEVANGTAAASTNTRIHATNMYGRVKYEL